MAEQNLLFSPSVISPAVASSFPDGYTIRPLARDDYHRGFFQCLQTLTATGDISEEQFHEQYDWIKANGQGWYYCVVIVDEKNDRIVGTGAMVVERKFIHNLGTIGHIEDISICKDHQGQQFGKRLIQTLDSIAVSVGCYKTILDCAERNEGFYAKCGYQRAGVEMAHYYEEPKSEYERG
ncbi:hypothetical protein VTN77DRAFT_6258 [Rasamsonia byssochlamydoides]|uniref:uncharacterized protein n=1 Tax=Rasamsonia byssochlamydoides TaxID=89139 RepID=UPI003742C3A9